MENKILAAAMQSREAYDRILSLLEPSEFSDHSQIVLKKVAAFYERDTEATAVDVELLLPQFEREYPKHYDMFAHLLKTLPDVSALNLLHEIKEHKKSAIGMRLSSALLSASADVDRLIEEYLEVNSLTDAVLEEEAPTLHDILEAFKPENLIKIWPLALNDFIGGGVPDQTHIIVFARTNIGKSAFCINMAAGACVAGRKTLYIGNEDSDKMMWSRAYSRMSGLNRLEMLQDIDAAVTAAEAKGVKNFIFKGLPGGTLADIEALVVKHKPEFLIVDQIRNIPIKGIDGEAQQLLAAGKAIRRITKQYNLVTVSVTQAADSAENKRVLEMGDIFYSNTSLQGDADLLLGFGADEKDKQLNRRTISVLKNKFNDNHGSLVVGIDPLLSKIISL